MANNDGKSRTKVCSSLQMGLLLLVFTSIGVVNCDVGYGVLYYQLFIPTNIEMTIINATFADADQLMTSLTSTTPWIAYDHVTACSSSPCGNYSACSQANSTNNWIFKCECDSGFDGSVLGGDFQCINIDECLEEDDNCSATLADCSDTIGGFACTCKTGYTGDGVVCSDIDDCVGVLCVTNANCVDQLNNYTCECQNGYTGDPSLNCTNIDDCAGVTCGANATCIDLINGYTCSCLNGYTGDANTSCADINECDDNSDDCHPTLANCSNTEGSHLCSCITGYTGDGINCTTSATTANFTSDFNILCESFPFILDLANATSSAYIALSDMLTIAIYDALTSVSTGSSSCSYVFSATDDSNEAMTDVSCDFYHTTISKNEIEIALNQLSETTMCGARASTDECNNGIASCDSSSTCVNTKFSYCCYKDAMSFTAETRLNSSYTASHGNLASADASNVASEVDIMATGAIDGISPRGCVASVNSELKHIENGSLIVVYTMRIVNGTFTADELTAALRAQVGVVSPNGTLVLNSGDYDECAADYARLRDCSDFASCLNTNGSFLCDCNPTYHDSNSSYAGRVCINPVTVSCNASVMQASVLKGYYEGYNISIETLHLLDEKCNKTTHGREVGDSVEFVWNYTDCNSTLTENSSYIIVGNEISNVLQYSAFTGHEINVPLRCVFAKSTNVSFSYTGSFNDIQFPGVQSVAQFKVIYVLCTDNSFATPQPFGATFLSTDTLYAKIYLQNDVGSSSIFLDKCWGTANPSATSQPSVTIVNNSCPTSNVAGFKMHSNGNGPVLFEHQAIFYPSTRSIFLHCKISVCAGSCPSTSTCSRRKRREAEDEGIIEASGLVSLFLRQSSVELHIPPKGEITDIRLSNYRVSNYVIVAVLALILIIIVVVATALLYRRRKSLKQKYVINW